MAKHKEMQIKMCGGSKYITGDMDSILKLTIAQHLRPVFVTVKLIDGTKIDLNTRYIESMWTLEGDVIRWPN